MKVLVTGSGGNVGRAVAEDLQKAGHEVVGVWRHTKPECVPFALLKSDLAREDVDMEGVDAVVHIAAALGGSSMALAEDNVVATMRLVKAAEKAGVKRFIYTSTISAYGQRKGQELKEDSDILYNMNNGVYGATKYISEKIVRESSVPCKVIITLTRMLGPYVHMEKRSGFLTMADKILKGEDVVCFIPNLPYNNYSHVADLADFVKLLIAGGMKEGCEKALLGVRERFTMMQILQIMKDAVNSPSKLIAEEREGWPECSLVNIDKALAMGYDPMGAEELLRRFMGEVRGRV